MAWYWLSFADPHRPAGTQFLGVTIIEGLNMLDACHTAHELDLNPGGQVRGWSMPVQVQDFPDLAAFSGKLLTADESRLANKALAAAIATTATKH